MNSYCHLFPPLSFPPLCIFGIELLCHLTQRLGIEFPSIQKGGSNGTHDQLLVPGGDQHGRPGDVEKRVATNISPET